MADDIQWATASGAGAIIVQIVGDGNEVTLGPRVALRLTDYGHFAHAADVEAGKAGQQGYTKTGRQEANLLVPYTASIPMVGRAPEMAATDAWLDGPNPLSVRVLTGAGGRGKTRLALEVARARRQKGWHAGFVYTDEFQWFLGSGNARDFRWNKPTLVVIDYAAGKAELVFRWLRMLLENPAFRPGENAPNLRLLLLDRAATRDEGWWQHAFGRGDFEGRQIERLVESASPVSLGPIAEGEDRRAVFAAAFRLAKDAEPALDHRIDEALARQSWGGEPLFLAMAGLYAARNGVPQALALPPDNLALDVAAEELARIRKVWVANGRPADSVDFAEHMAALATLCGGLSRTEAEGAIRREREALDCRSIGDTPRVRDALADALPGPAGGIAPILPDILGEAVMILAWKQADVGKAAAVRALATHRQQVVETVIRASRDFAIHDQQAPLAWLRGILAVTREEEELSALSTAIPLDTVELREIAACVVRAQLAQLGAGAGDTNEARRAQLLILLAMRLGALEQREDALAAAEEAYGILNRLAGTWPDRFLPGVAMALQGLARWRASLGQFDAALAANREAIAAYEMLAEIDADTFRPALAASWNGLSNRLAELGRYEEALAAIDEAVTIHSILAEARPEEFQPHLATSLINQSNCLVDLGRRNEALEAAQRSVAIRRHLAAGLPDAFLPDLAYALNTLSLHYRTLAEREQALALLWQKYEGGC